MHAVCRKREGQDSSLFFDDTGERSAVCADEMRNLRWDETDKARFLLFGGSDNVTDGAVVVS